MGVVQFSFAWAGHPWGGVIALNVIVFASVSTSSITPIAPPSIFFRTLSMALVSDGSRDDPGEIVSPGEIDDSFPPSASLLGVLLRAITRSPAPATLSSFIQLTRIIPYLFLPPGPMGLWYHHKAIITRHVMMTAEWILRLVFMLTVGWASGRGYKKGGNCSGCRMW